MFLQQLIDVAGHLDLTAREDQQVIAGSFEFGEDMRGQDDRQPVLGNRFHEALEEFAPGEWVQARDGLVEEKQFGSFRQSHGQRHLSLLSSRELMNAPLLRNAEPVQTSAGETTVPPGVEPASESQQVGNPELLVERSLLGHKGQSGKDDPRIAYR